MAVSRIKHLVLAMLAVPALMVSAVSACACSHHQVAASGSSSHCHDTGRSAHSMTGMTAESHERMASEVSAGCSCVVNSRVPFIVAKADKSMSSQHGTIAAPLSPFEFEPAVAVIHNAEAIRPWHAFRALSSKQNRFPARAPPRL